MLDDEDIFKGGNQQKRNPSFATERQVIGNPSNSALCQDDDDITPNQSTRGYPITQKFDRQSRYETQHTQSKENYSTFKNRFNPNPGMFDTYMPEHVLRYVSQYRNPSQLLYSILQTATRRNLFAGSSAPSENIDVSSVSNQIPTSNTYQHEFQQGTSCTDSAVYTAMTPSDHRTFI